jgi:hypothetical protein
MTPRVIKSVVYKQGRDYLICDEPGGGPKGPAVALQLPHLPHQGPQAHHHPLRTPLLVTPPLLSWQCFYKQDERSEVPCAVCGSLTEKNDTYPVFIEQDLEKDEDASVPERPLPVNRPKIANSDIIGTRNNQ